MQESMEALRGEHMKILCIDNEEKTLKETVAICRKLPRVKTVKGFTAPNDMFAWLEENTADIALIAINMPELDGLELAQELRSRKPDTSIVFLADSADYAVDAFALHVSGYLVKPVSASEVAREVMFAESSEAESFRKHVFVHTFGEFDVEVNGDTVAFSRARARELMAYLVDRQGRSVSRANAFSVLWEDEFYDRPMQKQMDVVVRSLRDTLRSYGIEEIFELKRGMMRIIPDRFECDLYRFFDGDVETVNSYRGEYMSAYSWASMTESYMERIVGNY